MSSDLPKTKPEKPKETSSLPDGATASLKATSGKSNAMDFENQNMSKKDKSTSGQNAKEPGIDHGSGSGKSKK